jgi:hypothetical protein
MNDMSDTLLIDYLEELFERTLEVIVENWRIISDAPVCICDKCDFHFDLLKGEDISPSNFLMDILQASRIASSLIR